MLLSLFISNLVVVFYFSPFCQEESQNIIVCSAYKKFRHSFIYSSQSQMMRETLLVMQERLIFPFARMSITIVQKNLCLQLTSVLLFHMKRNFFFCF